MSSSDNDIAAVSRAINDRAEECARHLYPSAKMEGGQLVVGSFLGEAGKSLKITIKGEHAGRCRDFEADVTTDILGATVLGRAITNIEAADYWRSYLGMEPFATNGKVHHEPKVDPLTFKHWRQGWKEARCGNFAYPYHSKAGALEGWVIRFDPLPDDEEQKKQCIPLHIVNGKPVFKLWCESDHRPLYNAHLLNRRLDAPVLILEGEKTADAAAKLFPSHVCVTWLGGCSMKSRVDWSQLKGRSITCWPDADKGGLEAMEYISSLFPGCKVVDVTRFPESWDLADDPPTGVSVKAFLESAKDPLPVQPWADAKTALEAVPVMDLKLPDPNDESELLKYRFLCRHGALLLVGPTGIGKSSFSLQAMFSWGMGDPFFDIHPVRPLKSLVIQAENDDGDMAEIRNGVLKKMNVPPEGRELLRVMVYTFHENRRTGNDFLEYVLRPLLEKYKPDLVWIDPMLAYLGGDSSDQGVVGAFLRNGLAPLLKEFNCGAILVHHTNKPPSGKDKPAWAAGDFAYMGTGSAEWANWPRAGLAIRNVGSSTKFELRAGKRGGRIGWRSEGGNRLLHRSISHSDDGSICWVLLPDEPDLPGKPMGRPPVDVASLNLHSFLARCPETGESLNRISARLEQWLADEHKLDLSLTTCKAKIRELLERGKLAKGGQGYVPGPLR